MTPRQPRARAQADAFLGLVKAAERLGRDFSELFRAHDLTMAQYNVLRILRGGPADGLACSEVGGRLVQHDPDVTRLLDRLEKRGLIARTRDARDRRVVRTRITQAGLELLGELDEPVDALHERQFGHMSEKKLGELVSLLAEASGPDP